MSANLSIKTVVAWAAFGYTVAAVWSSVAEAARARNLIPNRFFGAADEKQDSVVPPEQQVLQDLPTADIDSHVAGVGQKTEEQLLRQKAARLRSPLQAQVFRATYAATRNTPSNVPYIDESVDGVQPLFATRTLGGTNGAVQSRVSTIAPKLDIGAYRRPNSFASQISKGRAPPMSSAVL